MCNVCNTHKSYTKVIAIRVRLQTTLWYANNPLKNRTEFITMPVVWRLKHTCSYTFNSSAYIEWIYTTANINPIHHMHTLNTSIKRITHTSHVLNTAIHGMYLEIISTKLRQFASVIYNAWQHIDTQAHPTFTIPPPQQYLLLHLIYIAPNITKKIRCASEAVYLANKATMYTEKVTINRKMPIFTHTCCVSVVCLLVKFYRNTHSIIIILLEESNVIFSFASPQPS